MKKKRTQKIKGNIDRLRLTVFRSNAHIFAQLIDDIRGLTLVEASSLKLPKESKMNQAKLVGALIAKKALEKNLLRVVFDRRDHSYRGRVKALADSAREGGLIF